VHETVRVAAGVRAAWELHGPVGRHQTEAVPSSTPRLGHASSFDDDVIDAVSFELVAHREPSLTSADNHDVDVISHAILLA
jgi:hypothetical protein